MPKTAYVYLVETPCGTQHWKRGAAASFHAMQGQKGQSLISMAHSLFDILGPFHKQAAPIPVPSIQMTDGLSKQGMSETRRCVPVCLQARKSWHSENQKILQRKLTLSTSSSFSMIRNPKPRDSPLRGFLTMRASLTGPYFSNFFSKSCLDKQSG